MLPRSSNESLFAGAMRGIPPHPPRPKPCVWRLGLRKAIPSSMIDSTDRLLVASPSHSPRVVTFKSPSSLAANQTTTF